ncbi:MAG: DUF2442 domain-containing protein [Deltaproteobacteria bacterium]|nr:DUF2442 domain-containing protein [Deltaproteobacteria bacterium]
MTTLAVEIRPVNAVNVEVTEESLSVDLNDGGTILAPLAWFPRLLHGTQAERNNWRFIAGGEGIHWPDLDEDIRIENILSGKPSREGQRSFQQWLDKRRSNNQ